MYNLAIRVPFLVRRSKFLENRIRLKSCPWNKRKIWRRRRNRWKEASWSLIYSLWLSLKLDTFICILFFFHFFAVLSYKFKFIYSTLTKVDGGSILSVEFSWFQHLIYEHGQFFITIPFTFPQYVNPFSKKIPLSERINLGLNTGFDKEVILRTTSHPMKVKLCLLGCLSALYFIL